MASKVNVGVKTRSNTNLSKAEEKLEEYLISQYGDEIIKKSVNNPNKDSYKSVSIDCFANITDNTFNDFIKDNNLSNYIQLDKLVYFLTSESNNSSKNTRGKYHEYMNMIHAMYDVNIVGDLPNYYILDKTIKDKIMPKRYEYLICWWIKYKIDNDDFLSKYLLFNGDKLTTPTYQEPIVNTDERYYDVLFKKLDIIIEIQEDNNNHKNNMNDNIKEALAKTRLKRIIFFKLVDFKENNKNV